MNKQIIYFLKGLPGSGKSTWAKNWVNEDPSQRVRVNKDDLRMLLHNGKFSKSNEKQILKTQENIIIDSLRIGKSIVIDNTHLVETHLNSLKDTLLNYSLQNIDIEIKDFCDVPPEICIIRDLKRKDSVGQNVIWSMYWKYIADIAEYKNELYKEKAIIVDLDGTLATMTNRSAFEWHKVSQDNVKEHIKSLVNLYALNGYKVLITSGRDFVCYKETTKWLLDHKINYSQLFMRPENNREKDYLIKHEIYINNIKPYYNVELVIDDRPQVIREWRRLGLPVINANPIDEEF